MKYLSVALLLLMFSCNMNHDITHKELLNKSKIQENCSILGTLDMDIGLKKIKIKRDKLIMHGFLVETHTREGLKGGTIFLKNGVEKNVILGTSGENGYFYINSKTEKNDTLCFYFIGYNTLKFSLANISCSK